MGQVVQVVQVEFVVVGFLFGNWVSVVFFEGVLGVVVYQMLVVGEFVDQVMVVDFKVLIDNLVEIYVMLDFVYCDSEVVCWYFEMCGFQFGSIKYEFYEGVDGGIVL